MKRQLRIILALMAVGAGLSISVNQALAGKGSKGGHGDPSHSSGMHRGGSSFSGLARSSKSFHGLTSKSFSPSGGASIGNFRSRKLHAGNLNKLSLGKIPAQRFSNHVKKQHITHAKKPLAINTLSLGGITTGTSVHKVPRIGRLGKLPSGNSVKKISPLGGVKITRAPLTGKGLISVGPGFGKGFGTPKKFGPAGGIKVGKGFGASSANCKFVIDLLVRNYKHHGGHCSPCIKRHCASPGWVEWVPVVTVVQPVVVQQLTGDLELLGVSLVSDGNGQQGPTYQATFRNASRVPVSHFRISLVAVLGEMEETSPSVTIDVPQLGPGQTGSEQLELPIEATAMGPAGQSALFDTLVVAIDSFDELVESNELNNVATLKRADVRLVSANAVQPAPGQTEQAAQMPNAAAAENSPEAATSGLSNPAPETATDSVSLEELGLTQAEGAGG